jgi:hypothetical protein
MCLVWINMHLTFHLDISDAASKLVCEMESNNKFAERRDC